MIVIAILLLLAVVFDYGLDAAYAKVGRKYTITTGWCLLLAIPFLILGAIFP